MTKWLNWQPNTETEPKKGGMEAQDLNGKFVCLFVFICLFVHLFVLFVWLFVCFSLMAELAAKYRDRAKERRDGGPGSER